MSRQLRHRTRSEIIPSILEVTNGNKVRINEIELKVCLPYNILNEYLANLLQYGLVEYMQGERAFKTTPKGLHALIKYHMLEEMLIKSH